MRKKIKGFTLIELVITLMIVITLSLISWPIYRGRHREYTMLAEGYALLGAIKEAQINYYNEFGHFALQNPSGNAADQWTARSDVLGINAMNNRYFSWFNPTLSGYYWHNGGNSNNILNYNIYKSGIIMEVRSRDAGTIRLKFCTTGRDEPQVFNATNVTFY
ncbi:MAG: prepilin-type N-terminal cleavage/methylation domain-containing protein [Elusimicrobia bacterium]|nr:prepilin-type N-terminal cleavage/methylation domain-containing protein [Elusimicrobiota bacterium]